MTNYDPSDKIYVLFFRSGVGLDEEFILVFGGVLRYCYITRNSTVSSF